MTIQIHLFCINRIIICNLVDFIQKFFRRFFAIFRSRCFADIKECQRSELSHGRYFFTFFCEIAIQCFYLFFICHILGQFYLFTLYLG